MHPPVSSSLSSPPPHFPPSLLLFTCAKLPWALEHFVSVFQLLVGNIASVTCCDTGSQNKAISIMTTAPVTLITNCSYTLLPKTCILVAIILCHHYCSHCLSSSSSLSVHLYLCLRCDYEPSWEQFH